MLAIAGDAGTDMGVVRRRPEEAEARKGASGKGGYMTLQNPDSSRSRSGMPVWKCALPMRTSDRVPTPTS